MSPRILVIFALTLLVSWPASSQDARTDLGLIASTEGAGLEIAHAWTSRLRGRLGVAGFSVSESFSTDAVRYEGDADLRSAALVIDVSPFGGSFHLSAGMVFQDHDIRGSAPIEDFARRELGQDVVDQIRQIFGPIDFGTLNATAELDSVAPYAGLGFRSARTTRGLGFAFDVGAIFFGEPDIEVTANTDLPLSQFPEAEFLAQAFLEQEERELQDEVDGYDVFPVVRFSLFYRF